MIQDIKKTGCSGSMTMEAAILTPLFLFVMMTLLSIIDMMHFYERVEQGLHQTCRKMAVYAPASVLVTGSQTVTSANEINGIAATVLGDQYAKNSLLEHLTQQEIDSSGLVGGSGGFNFMYSEIMQEGDLIDLVVSYQLEPRNNFFMLPAYPVLNRCRMRSWTGYEVIPKDMEDSAERMVYITETGNVFHLTETCTYLDLSIYPVTNEELSERRSESGGIYQSCEICGGEAEIYYITNYGTCYHTTLSCSGIKRTVYQVPISQAGDRNACSRCGSGG